MQNRADEQILTFKEVDYYYSVFKQRSLREQNWTVKQKEELMDKIEATLKDTMLSLMLHREHDLITMSYKQRKENLEKEKNLIQDDEEKEEMMMAALND